MFSSDILNDEFNFGNANLSWGGWGEEADYFFSLLLFFQRGLCCLKK